MATKKISEATQQVIDRAKAQFDESTIALGNKIAYIEGVTRNDMTKALAGDVEAVEKITRRAVRKKLVRKGDADAVTRALEWIRLTRTITSHR